MNRIIKWMLQRAHFIHNSDHAHALQLSDAQDRALQRLIKLVEAQRAGKEGNRNMNRRAGDIRT